MDRVLIHPRSTWLRIVLIAMACLAGEGALAQPASEAAVKAAFLYKFAGYVEWPPPSFPTPETPYVIGVAGAEEVAAELERLVAGRSVNGRRVVARRVRDAASAAEVHVLFVGREDGRLRELLRAAQRLPVLTVTDASGGLELGSVVALTLLEDRIGFEVSTLAAERGGLAISSRMLGVARRVLRG